MILLLHHYLGSKDNNLILQIKISNWSNMGIPRVEISSFLHFYGYCLCFSPQQHKHCHSILNFEHFCPSHQTYDDSMIGTIEQGSYRKYIIFNVLIRQSCILSTRLLELQVLFHGSWLDLGINYSNL